MDFLKSAAVENFEVQFIVETQLLLRPYLEGRTKMHLLYKICRADSPQALCSDFKTIELRAEERLASYSEVQKSKLEDVKQFIKEEKDVNRRSPEKGGPTRLWLAAEQGHVEAVRELLKHTKIDPNKTKLSSKSTPLYIASYRGHDDVVAEIVAHPCVRVNLGKIDTGASPLFAAAQEGHEEVVKILLQQSAVDVNQAIEGGVTPLCSACHEGHEHIVKLLMEVAQTDARHETRVSALSVAEMAGHPKIVEMLKSNELKLK